MHVGINLIFLVPGKTGGMEIYARELITALRQMAPELQLTTFINHELAAARPEWLAGLPTIMVPVTASNRLEWVWGEQVLLPGLAKRAGIDLLHSLSSTSPAYGSFRRVVTILDLHYRLFPETHAGLRSYGMRMLVPLAARTAHRVIAISQNTAQDVRRFLKTPKEKIDVIPLGLGITKTVEPLPEPETRVRFSLGNRPLLLTMAAKRPHKNLVRLLDALAAIPKARRPVLVLPGYPTEHEAVLQQHAEALQISDDVRFRGWISAEEAEGLYACATAFVFPSLYEGFGLPVLEAMARGVPVACSDRGSLKEVAGSAALVFNPEKTEEITAAIETLLTNDEERSRLRGVGWARAREFTWERTAQETITTYQKALSSR